MEPLQWPLIQPGDIGFDGGKGVFGWLIRRATGSRAHTWIYVRFLGTTEDGEPVWLTDEAGPFRVQERIRTRRPVKVVRLWRSSTEQEEILLASQMLLGQPYSWREIIRLAVYRVTGKTWKTDPHGYICSGHVATAVAEARPDLAYGKLLGMRHPTHRIWPDELANWSDTVIWRQLVLPDTAWQTGLENLMDRQ
jgi:hypothetical protein